MKKLLFTILTVGLSSGIFSQEAADKNVQAGLVVGFGLNFQKMGTKNMATNGVGNDVTIGANVNFSFTETIGLCTGVEFDFSTVKYKSATATPTYYRFNDSKILENEDSDNSNNLFQLTARRQKGVYITIPTMLLFRTNFIGYFRYFGKFGMRNSFLLSSKINDTGFTYNPENSALGVPSGAENTNMKAPGDMFFYKGSVGLALGTEWNFTGSTCLVAELGYYYGITPLHLTSKDKNMTLFTSGEDNGTGNDIYFANKATQSQLMLKVSILF